MTDQEEIAELIAGWGDGSYDSPEECALDHYLRHAKGITLLEYLREADMFPRHHARMKVGLGGRVTYKHRDGRYLIVDADQRIVSYGYDP